MVRRDAVVAVGYRLGPEEHGAGVAHLRQDLVDVGHQQQGARRRSLAASIAWSRSRTEISFVCLIACSTISARPAFEQELPQAGRAEIVEQAIKHTKLILVRDLDHAMDAANDLAAEHLLLLVSDVDEVLPKVRNAGAVFLGHWTAVPYGDYGVASNHVLPTAGTARFSSGLRASDYVTVSSVIQMSPEAARRFTPGTSAIARAEGLVGHAKAMDARAEEAGEA